MTEAASQRSWHLICVVLLALMLLIFLKNAWICDDAYINFRSLEQLYAGNGPNWNPHERVQGYTSPLWYWLLALARAVSSDHFFNAFLLSLLLFLLLGLVLQKYFGNNAGFATMLLLAAGSNAFFDFTTSGLENILCYLLLTVALLSGFAALKAEEAAGRRHYWRALVALALIPVCRHDLFILTLLPALVLITEGREKFGRVRWFDLVVLLLPLALWSVFSLVYYGALFPNTAYAKLLTGLSRPELITQGLRYLWVTFTGDPVTMLVIGAGLAAAFVDKRIFVRAAGTGLALNLAYVVFVGGDFMRGRFVAVPFLAALLLLAESRLIERLLVAKTSLLHSVAIIFICFLALFPHTPANTGLNYQDFSLNHGIADERGYYFDVCSLYAYLYSRPGEIFPEFEWSQIGRQIAVSGVGYLENDFNGMLGFWAGTRPIIIDRLALTDPFLARQPVTDLKGWRIGHFKREVPEDYRRSIEKGQNLFRDPDSAALYEKILHATREQQFFSFKRLLAIVKLNLGIK